MKNPKSEIRSSKQFPKLELGNSNFGLRICFEFRAWDFVLSTL